jgi:hypothetical protein
MLLVRKIPSWTIAGLLRVFMLAADPFT